MSEFGTAKAVVTRHGEFRAFAPDMGVHTNRHGPGVAALDTVVF